MLIEEKKNLEFVKRAFDSHLVNCCQAAVRASDKLVKEKWDPEIEETQKMLDAVEVNLRQYRDESQTLVLERSSLREKTPSVRHLADHSPQGGRNTDFFR
jgi:septal ring factor EnvC (AmiA/AmiB activator)